MPETSMDENYFSARGEDEVGTPRQLTNMKSVTMAERMNQTPHNHFGASVFSSNA